MFLIVSNSRTRVIMTRKRAPLTPHEKRITNTRYIIFKRFHTNAIGMVPRFRLVFSGPKATPELLAYPKSFTIFLYSIVIIVIISNRRFYT